MKSILLARMFGNVQAIVHGIGRTRRDQADINYRAGGPGVALIDLVAARVHLQRAKKMCALFDRPFAIVLYAPAPENIPALFVGGRELEPAVKCIHGAAGEEVPDLAGTHDNNTAHTTGAAQGGLDTIERCGQWSNRGLHYIGDRV